MKRGAPAKGKANKVAKIVETTTPAPIDSREAKLQKGTKGAWIKVGGKKNAIQKRRLRPELIIISKKGDVILRKVKSDPELMALGETVSRIRCFQKGDLMLELKKSPDETVENFLGKVEKPLGEEAKVRARKQEIIIKVKTLMKSRPRRISATP